MKRSTMLQIYLGYLYEKCDILPKRLKIMIIIATQLCEQYNGMEKNTWSVS